MVRGFLGLVVKSVREDAPYCVPAESGEPSGHVLRCNATGAILCVLMGNGRLWAQVVASGAGKAATSTSIEPMHSPVAASISPERFSQTAWRMREPRSSAMIWPTSINPSSFQVPSGLR
jgi:hypothetical protein